MFTENQKITVLAGEALAKRCRVKLSGSSFVYADAGEEAQGVSEYAIANAARGAIRTMDGLGTYEMTAAGAIAAGAPIFGAADGKVSATPSGTPIGRAIEAATADGDIIECLVIPLSDFPLFAGKTFEAVTDNKTLDVQDNGKVMLVTADAKTVTLPATGAGFDFIIMNGGADGAVAVNVSPNAADKIMGPDIAGTDNKDQINTKATAKTGDFIHVVGGHADGYIISHIRGTWAEEA